MKEAAPAPTASITPVIPAAPKKRGRPRKDLTFCTPEERRRILHNREQDELRRERHNKEVRARYAAKREEILAKEKIKRLEIRLEKIRSGEIPTGERLKEIKEERRRAHLEHDHEYRRANRERISLHNQAYYASHKEYFREYYRKYWERRRAEKAEAQSKEGGAQ